MHGCVLITVATDAVVLKHPGITIHSAEEVLTALDHFYTKILRLYWISENKIIFLKNDMVL